MSRMRFPWRIVNVERLRELEEDAAAYRAEHDFDPEGLRDALDALKAHGTGAVGVQRSGVSLWLDAVERRKSEYPAS